MLCLHPNSWMLKFSPRLLLCVFVCIHVIVMTTLLKCCSALLSLVSFSFHFNAGSGNLQHSPTGSSGQAAIERPQGITVLLQFSRRTRMEGADMSKYTTLCALALSRSFRLHVHYYQRWTLYLAVKVPKKPVSVKRIISEHYHNSSTPPSSFLRGGGGAWVMIMFNRYRFARIKTFVRMQMIFLCFLLVVLVSEYCK